MLGGFVSILIISEAACLRYVSMFVCGSGMMLGINLTVSHTRSLLVRGK